MKFIKELYYRWFGFSKLNKDLSTSFDNFDLSKSLDILSSHPNIVFRLSTVFSWLILQKKVMNGDYQNNNLKKINDNFIAILSNEKNDFVRKDIEKQFDKYTYNFKLNNINIDISSLNNKQNNDISFNIISFSQENLLKSEEFYYWLFYQWKFKNFLDFHSDVIETLFQDMTNFRKANSICYHQTYLFVLINLIKASIENNKNNDYQNKMAQKMVEEYKFQEGTPFDFSIVDNLEIPESAKEALRLLDFIYQESWVNTVSSKTEDGFNIYQILHVHIGRTIYNYLSMPEEFRDNMKNAEGLNMTELLFSNLDKYLTLLTKIRENQSSSQAEILLKKQSVQNKLVDKKINEV